jgi:hypothetical protein
MTVTVVEIARKSSYYGPTWTCVPTIVRAETPEDRADLRTAYESWLKRTEPDTEATVYLRDYEVETVDAVVARLAPTVTLRVTLEEVVERVVQVEVPVTHPLATGRGYLPVPDLAEVLDNGVTLSRTPSCHVRPLISAVEAV